MLGEYYSPEIVAEGQALGNYSEYRYKLEGTPHGAIHSSIGGDMVPSTSPNGMLIILPHCYFSFSLRVSWLTNWPSHRSHIFLASHSDRSVVVPMAATRSRKAKL